MDSTERNVIDDLFEKLRLVEQKTAPRDHQAEAHIHTLVARQPAAPYYMAQAIVMQEQALAAATDRIAEMERERAARPVGQGFLGGLFGGGESPASGRRPHATSGDRRNAPTAGPGQAVGPWQTGGPGFLGGAMQTAVGVAGGMMLATALGGVLGTNEATAAESEIDKSSSAFDDSPEDGDFGADDGDGGLLEDF